MAVIPNLDALSVFVIVAESGSFSAAARKLGVAKSSVSRAVAALEAALGAQLLHRTTRTVALSTAGAALYQNTAPAIAGLHAALGSLPEREEHPSGELRLTAPNDLGATLLAEVAVRFTTRYPAVRVDVRLTNRKVDLVAEGFDLAVRATGGKLADSSLVMRRMCPIEAQVFASPAYLARRGTPRAPADTAEHDWVTFRGWRYRGELAFPAAGARVMADDLLFMREAVRAGGGLALLPVFLTQSDLATGQLVRVLPRYSETAGSFVLLHPRARQIPRKVTAFRDFLLEFLAARPLGNRSA